MKRIEEFLEEEGPQLAGEIKDYLLSFGISDDNARQKISRSRKNVRRLNVINFPKKEKFLFLAYQYKTPKFYASLYDAFKKRNLVFGDLISSILCLGNSIGDKRIHVISGAPNVGKKKYASEEIIQKLVKLEFLESNHVDDKIMGSF